MSFTIGKCKVSVIHEQDMPDMRGLIPKATKENIRGIQWLRPHFATEEGVAHGVIQAFVVETPDHLIVVDTCIGDDKPRLTLPEWNLLQSGFMNRFQDAGFEPESVTHVLCTHLHVDHVGWNTYWTGTDWAPTFPNAHYLFADNEFEFWSKQREIPPGDLADATNPHKRGAIAFDLDMRETHKDSIQPILDAGLAKIVTQDYRLSNEIRFVPTPGHTPGHVAICIESQGETAIITGDCIHHPCQIAKPSWSTIADVDAELGIETRHSLLNDLVANGGLLIGTHFSAPTGGQIAPDEDGFRLITPETE